ncbi:immunity protein YezG family protein [Rheinheimera faecalis]
MMNHMDIYKRIGQILLERAPQNAKKILMDAELSSEGDVGTFKFSFFDDTDALNYFAGGAKANNEMLDLLVKLRHEFIESNQGKWLRCLFELNTENLKFAIDFKYE